MNVPQVTLCVPMALSVSTSLAEWPVPACLGLCRMEYNVEVRCHPKRVISGETHPPKVSIKYCRLGVFRKEYFRLELVTKWCK